MGWFIGLVSQGEFGMGLCLLCNVVVIPQPALGSSISPWGKSISSNNINSTFRGSVLCLLTRLIGLGLALHLIQWYCGQELITHLLNSCLHLNNSYEKVFLFLFYLQRFVWWRCSMDVQSCAKDRRSFRLLHNRLVLEHSGTEISGLNPTSKEAQGYILGSSPCPCEELPIF